MGRVFVSSWELGGLVVVLGIGIWGEGVKVCAGVERRSGDFGEGYGSVGVVFQGLNKQREEGVGKRIGGRISRVGERGSRGSRDCWEIMRFR